MIYYAGNGKSFLSDLVDGILEKFGSNEALQRVKVFLPTKRSCRMFDKVFIKKNFGRFSIIPKTYPIQNIDEMDVAASYAHYFRKINLNKSISKTEEFFLLMQILSETESKYLMDVNNSQASVAKQLMFFFKELSDYNIDINMLDSYAQMQEYSLWTELSSFIKKIYFKLEVKLKERNLVTEYQKQNNLINALSNLWKEEGSGDILIAASILTSNIHIKNFLKTLSSLDSGYVILHKIETESEVWNKINKTHPMSLQKEIINYLCVSFDQINNWCSLQSKPRKFIDIMFFPAELSYKWHSLQKFRDIEYCEIVECENQLEEAKIIALITKYHLLSFADEQIAIIIDDYNVRKRLVCELENNNILVNDTIGVSLKDTAFANLLILILQFADNQNDAHILLSILKHERVNIGETRESHLEMTYELENKYLRGLAIKNLKFLLNKLSGDLYNFYSNFYNIFQNFISSKKLSLETWVIRHLGVIEHLLNIQDTPEEIYKCDGGKLLHQFCSDLINGCNGEEITFANYIAIFYNQILNYSYKVKSPDQAKVHLVTASESRLLDVDVIIISGMNEGSWPPSATNSWFNQNIRKKIGLPSIDGFVADKAADLYQLLHYKKTYLIRANYGLTGIEQESRWITRLKFLSNYLVVENKLFSNNPWVRWSNIIEKSDKICNIFLPEPTSVLEKKPKKLSITQIELLKKSPYSFYAKYILKLKKLDEISMNPINADFGVLIHKCLDEYNKSEIHNEEIFENITKNNLLKYKDYYVYNFWQERINNLKQWFVSFYDDLSKEYKIFSEINGEISFKIDDIDFAISAKADLVAIKKDKMGAFIADYKTGATPTVKDIVSYNVMQLHMEAILLSKNAFPNIEFDSMFEKELLLSYIGLAFNENKPEFNNIQIDNLPEFIFQSKKTIYDLVKDYSKHNYVFSVLFGDKINRFDDYLHLSRYEEWEKQNK